jgi:hypothetical protein
VLIAGFDVDDRLGRLLRPDGGDPIGNMVSHVAGLAGLEVEPVGVQVFVGLRVGLVVDAGGLR